MVQLFLGLLVFGAISIVLWAAHPAVFVGWCVFLVAALAWQVRAALNRGKPPG